jgi:hypothetical protein
MSITARAFNANDSVEISSTTSSDIAMAILMQECGWKRPMAYFNALPKMQRRRLVTRTQLEDIVGNTTRRLAFGSKTRRWATKLLDTSHDALLLTFEYHP